MQQINQEKIQEVVMLARKRHISYDKALVIYNKANMQAPATPKQALYDQLVEKMKGGVVQFEHVSKLGKKVVNFGTLNPERIAKRKPAKMGERFAGTKVSKKDGVGTYFDVIHGMYRPVIKDNVTAILG